MFIKQNIIKQNMNYSINNDFAYLLWVVVHAIGKEPLILVALSIVTDGLILRNRFVLG